MDRRPPTQLDLDSDEDMTPIDDGWLDERTVRIDFTMEHHGAVAELSLAEQFLIVGRFKR